MLWRKQQIVSWLWMSFPKKSLLMRIVFEKDCTALCGQLKCSGDNWNVLVAVEPGNLNNPNVLQFQVWPMFPRKIVLVFKQVSGRLEQISQLQIRKCFVFSIRFFVCFWCHHRWDWDGISCVHWLQTSKGEYAICCFNMLFLKQQLSSFFFTCVAVKNAELWSKPLTTSWMIVTG